MSDGLLSLCPNARGIAAAYIRRSANDQPVLEWAEFVPTERDQSARRAAVEHLVKARELEDPRATSLISIGDYSLILVETPDVPPPEMRQAVRWRVKELIDFDVDDAVIDIFEVPTQKGGRENMIYAVIARSPAVRALIEGFTDTGVNLEYVDIPEFAIRNLTALMPEDVGGVAFIYLEEDVGLITITRQNTLYLSRRFDYGRARLLQAGTAEVTPVLKGLLDAIVIEIQRSLDYYESYFAQPSVQGVVLAPLGTDCSSICDYLSSQLGVTSRVMGIADVIEMQGHIDDDQAANCVSAVGAALRFGEVML